jgi:hypothetical protein
MAEQDLNDPDVGAGFKEMGRKGMSERAYLGSFRQTGGSAGLKTDLLVPFTGDDHEGRLCTSYRGAVSFKPYSPNLTNRRFDLKMTLCSAFPLPGPSTCHFRSSLCPFRNVALVPGRRSYSRRIYQPLRTNSIEIFPRPLPSSHFSPKEIPIGYWFTLSLPFVIGTNGSLHVLSPSAANVYRQICAARWGILKWPQVGDFGVAARGRFSYHQSRLRGNAFDHLDFQPTYELTG